MKEIYVEENYLCIYFPSIFELNKLFNQTEMLSDNECAVLGSFAEFQFHFAGLRDVSDCQREAFLPLKGTIFGCWFAVLYERIA